MKLAKIFPVIKLPGFTYWRVKLMAIFNFRLLWQDLIQMSTKLRFRLVITALILLSGLAFILGFGNILQLDLQLTQINQRFDQQIAAFNDLRSNLANLPVAYNDELAAVPTIPAKHILADINREFQQLPGRKTNDPGSALLQTSLGKIADYLAGPVALTNYYELWAEVGKAQTYLDRYEKQLHLPAQKQAAGQAINMEDSLKELLLLLIIISCAVYLLLVIFKEGKYHQATVTYFDNFVKRLKEGKIQPGELPHQTRELIALQAALVGYFKRLSDRYQGLIVQINDFGQSLQELAEWVAANDRQQVAIKLNLKDYIKKTYLKLDKFPDLSEQITYVNSSLDKTQEDALRLQGIIKQTGEQLTLTPESVHNYQAQVAKEGKYYREVSDHLKDLKLLLDGIQQTVTAFYSISEQANQLSLNASIEAARAGEVGDNFSLTATEIEDLALKISKATKDLINVSVLMSKKTVLAIRVLEKSLGTNKMEESALADINTKVESFIVQVTDEITKIGSYTDIIYDFETEEQNLEKVALILAELKLQSPMNYGRAIAALDVIIGSDKLVTSADQLSEKLAVIKQTIDQIQYIPNLEEP